jgi:hypothetical protein
MMVQDELIGETIIDLEDRFFHPKWQEWGVTAKRAKEVSQRASFSVSQAISRQSQLEVEVVFMLNVAESRRCAEVLCVDVACVCAQVGPVKPLENRDLWVQRSRNPQGQVQLWADVLTVKEARRYQKEVLAGPPELKVGHRHRAHGPS